VLARLLIAAAVVVSGWTSPVLAQGEAGLGPGTWRLHSSMRDVRAIATAPDAVWAGTDGGLFRYDLGSGEIERFTTVEGLANLTVRALAYDERHDVLWIGYDDGVIDRLDAPTGTVRSFLDISRAERFTQRAVNALYVAGDSLLVATSFGVVVFDTRRGEVRDTYERFATLEAATPVNDVIAAPLPNGQEGLWVATDAGLVHAPRAAPNLRVPSSWAVVDGSPVPSLAVAFHAGHLYVGKGRRTSPGEDGDLHRLRADGTWERMYVSTDAIGELSTAAGQLLAAAVWSFGVVDALGVVSRYGISDASILRAIAGSSDGQVWIGTREHGLLRMPALAGRADQPVEPASRIIPAGPILNQITSVGVGPDGSLWTGHTTFGPLDGMGRFDGATWTNFSTVNGHDAATAPIRALHVDRRGMAWGASEGNGLMRVSPDGEVITFRSNNSTLQHEPGFPGFIVTQGVDEDLQGRIWVTNRNAPRPLHVWTPDAGWRSFERPAGVPTAAARFVELHVDRFGNKWISLWSTTQARGNGFLVWRSSNLDDPRDGEVVAITGSGTAATGTGLPDPQVNAIAQDLDGRMWLGTSRGLGVVFSPGSVFANPAVAQPVWARTPDQASYFLRDLTVFAIAVDPAGRKWLGSSDGAWLINAEGNEVLAHFTPENSPLPAATIVDVAIDGISGTVYFATSAGVVAYRGDSVAPATRAGDLRVYPSPFRPSDHPNVRVEGLVAATRIRILTTDGQVVAAFDARGGSATWDGRDQRTGQLVPSGVYVVAASGVDGQGTGYGKIVVIR
jgi:ligand-binding sensor domain-containing protein